MQKIIFKLIMLLVITNSYSQNINLNIGESKSKIYYSEIDFEFIKNKVIVPVQIDGITYKFLLDTGAPNIISKEIEKRINPKLINSIPVSDANNKKEELKLVSVENLKIGNIEFVNTATLVYDLNSNPVFKCFGIDGFIGSNMLRKSIIQIDVEAKKLIITNKKKLLNLKKKESQKMKLVGVQSSPYIWVDLKGKENGREQLLVDTGMEGLYDLSLSNYRLLSQKQVFNQMGKSIGASSLSLFGDVKSNEHYQLLLPVMKINGTKLLNLVTHTTDDKNSRIGAELLKYGTMTIDFKNRRFYYKPFLTDISIDNSDFGFTRTLKENKLIVGFVWDNKLKNKIKYGDEIVEIDNAPVNICTLIKDEVFSKAKKNLKIKVKNELDEIFEIIIERKTYGK